MTADDEVSRSQRLDNLEVRKVKSLASLRCAVVEGGGAASGLLVVVPPLRGVGVRTKLDRELGSIAASTGEHVLLVNADDDLFYGPGRQAKGLHALTMLITREVEQRGVRLSDVTLLGRQYGGSIALWAASVLPVGRVVAARAPVRLGTFLRSLVVPRVKAPATPESDDAGGRPDGAAADIDERPGDVDVFEGKRGFEALGDERIAGWLDRVIDRGLADVTHPLAIDLFASGHVAREMTRLHHDLARHRSIRSTLIERSPDGPDVAEFVRSCLVPG